ncbi:hypothetical protein Q3G72_020933 [Acer saccharum]|nr:hypothetical protein Q3G72_020933 [Acer saccharum]
MDANLEEPVAAPRLEGVGSSSGDADLAGSHRFRFWFAAKRDSRLGSGWWKDKTQTPYLGTNWTQVVNPSLPQTRTGLRIPLRPESDPDPPLCCDTALLFAATQFLRLKIVWAQ